MRVNNGPDVVVRVSQSTPTYNGLFRRLLRVLSVCLSRRKEMLQSHLGLRRDEGIRSHQQRKQRKIRKNTEDVMIMTRMIMMVAMVVSKGETHMLLH